MFKRFLPIVSVFIITVFLFGFAAAQKEFVRRSPEELPIKASLMNLQEAWKNCNLDAVLATVHENAQLMTGRDQKIVSKNGYANYVGMRFRQGVYIVLGSPEILVTGDQAVVKLTWEERDGGMTFSSYMTISMVKEHNKWLWMKSEY